MVRDVPPAPADDGGVGIIAPIPARVYRTRVTMFDTPDRDRANYDQGITGIARTCDTIRINTRYHYVIGAVGVAEFSDPLNPAKTPTIVRLTRATPAAAVHTYTDASVAIGADTLNNGKVFRTTLIRRGLATALPVNIDIGIEETDATGAPCDHFRFNVAGSVVGAYHFYNPETPDATFFCVPIRLCQQNPEAPFPRGVRITITSTVCAGANPHAYGKPLALTVVSDATRVRRPPPPPPDDDAADTPLSPTRTPVQDALHRTYLAGMYQRRYEALRNDVDDDDDDHRHRVPADLPMQRRICVG